MDKFVKKFKEFFKKDKSNPNLENEIVEDLAYDALDAFCEGAQHNTTAHRTVVPSDPYEPKGEYLASTADGIIFELKKSTTPGNVIVNPYTMIYEEDFEIPVQHLVEFFNKVGAIVYKLEQMLYGYKINAAQRKRNDNAAEKAKDQIEELIHIYNSKQLTTLSKTGILD